MMWQGLAGILTGGLSRFRVVGLLPAAFLVSVVLALVALGEPPRWSNLKTAVDDLTGTQLVLLALGIACLALLTHALQLPLVRLLEGYWAWWPRCPGWLAVGLVARQRKRFEKAVSRSARGDGSGPALVASSRRGIRRETRDLVPLWRQQHVTERLNREFPDREHIMPTRLGNALRAAEDGPYRRYGLDAVTLWPALYCVLGPRVRETVDDQRDQLDYLVHLSVAMGLLVPVTLGKFLAAGVTGQGRLWLLVPVLLLAGSMITYRIAVSAAVTYGILIETAYALHRFDLLRALHLPLPEDSDQEVSAGRDLTDLFSSYKPTSLVYRHPDTDWHPPSTQPPA